MIPTQNDFYSLLSHKFFQKRVVHANRLFFQTMFTPSSPANYPKKIRHSQGAPSPHNFYHGIHSSGFRWTDESGDGRRFGAGAALLDAPRPSYGGGEGKLACGGCGRASTSRLCACGLPRTDGGGDGRRTRGHAGDAVAVVGTALGGRPSASGSVAIDDDGRSAGANGSEGGDGCDGARGGRWPAEGEVPRRRTSVAPPAARNNQPSPLPSTDTSSVGLILH